MSRAMARGITRSSSLSWRARVARLKVSLKVRARPFLVAAIIVAAQPSNVRGSQTQLPVQAGAMQGMQRVPRSFVPEKL